MSDEHEYASVDPDLISQFESAWLEGKPKSIQECLPSSGDARYLGTLEELVHIDLEFRWKQWKKAPSESKPLSVETYLEHFPELDRVKLGLIQGEFELASRFGQAVSVEEFVSRFGDSVSGSQLRPILESQLSEMVRSNPVKPGVTLGRYEIVDEHGRGGFGAVWRATDTKLGRRIAVKQLGQTLASDSESRRRFISEARVTARLEHPGIVPVYDISNVQEDHAYYTMRLIQGRTLAEAIADLHEMEFGSNEFRLLRQRLLQSFVDVCLTIEYAHAQGVIHRDLKPQNIIVGDYGETILLDWGLASVIDDPGENPGEVSLGADPEVLSKEESMETIRGSVLGTPAYMSPEQARGDVENISKLSDVYSLGATLYHLVTGEIPFTDQALDELLERVKVSEIPAANELNPQVEKSLSCITAQAMRNEAQHRYASVAALVDDVQRFIADQPVSAYRDPLLARAARWIRKHPTAAAALVLTAVFILLASIASLMVNQAWKDREDKRIAELQIAAERSDATSLSQIRNGRFESASKNLSQAAALVDDEPQLRQVAIRLKDRQQRTQRIVDFYQLGMRAQEETFFDRTNRAAIYCQAALDELGVLDHPSWWQHLPDDDLSELQKEQLRSEVYRVTTLLASMRLAETAENAMSLNILIDPESIPEEAPARQSIQAASFAAKLANGYRSSRAMKLIDDVNKVTKSEKAAVELTNLNPLNSVDSAVMGSILDNNVPTEGMVRTAISGLLEMRNPNVVAEQWLGDALKYNPDWYWLPVFMGHSQMRSGKAEEGIRTISHAVGLRPDYWVGYQYRALASVAAAATEKSRKRKTALLNAASRDIQRALDLEPYNSELFWTKAIIQYNSGANPDQIREMFLTAFELHPGLVEIRGGHYSAITRMFFERAQAFVEWQKSQENESADLVALEIAIQIWQSQLDQADTIFRANEAQFADSETLKNLGQWISNAKGRKTGSPIQVSQSSRFAWRLHLANAEYFANQNDTRRQFEALQAAMNLAQVEWQKSRSQTELAACLIRLGDDEKAAGLISEAVALDRAVNLEAVSAAAAEYEATSSLQVCEQVNLSRIAKTKFSESEIIDRPALLNSGFELGLSYHWSPYSRRTTSATWNNFGQSRTTAEADAIQAHEGERCLVLNLDCPEEEKSYGQMSQTVPVSMGHDYELTFWAKIDSAAEAKVIVGVLDKGLEDFLFSVALDKPDGSWRQYRLQFSSTRPKIELAIRAQGLGSIRMDDFQIQTLK